MGMPIELSVYEALTSAGVSPDKARLVERQIESAIQTGQETIRAEMRDQLMTKADAASLKLELKADMSALKSHFDARFNDHLRWLITSQIAVAGLLLAGIKLL
jgi:hypothetical protein